jgi:putative flippase GtrA
MPFALPVAASHVVGMLVAFALTRMFVFESTRDNRMSEPNRLGQVNVDSLGQTWVVAMATLNFELTAHVLGLGCSSITSFFGHSRVFVPGGVKRSGIRFTRRRDDRVPTDRSIATLVVCRR